MELSCEHCCWGAAWGCRVVHCWLPLCVGWEGMSCSGAGGYQLGWAVSLVGGGQLLLNTCPYFHLEDGIWCHFSPGAQHRSKCSACAGLPAGFHMFEWDQTLGPVISASC